MLLRLCTGFYVMLFLHVNHAVNTSLGETRVCRETVERECKEAT